MEQIKLTTGGMVTTPHYLASQSGLAILREGGTAIEATLAAAATLSVVCPHLNGLGGDGFWLIIPPHGEPLAIEACGAAGSLANLSFFEGEQKIPLYGPKSASTVAGTVGGWQEALNYVAECGYQPMPLSRILKDAINYAEEGYPILSSYERILKRWVDLDTVTSEFKEIFLPNGEIPKEGEKLYQKQLAKTLRYLAENGVDSFYRGELADLMADDMKSLGMPITKSDLENYKPIRKTPLRLLHTHGEVFNVPPPTQGLASLVILGILDKLQIDGKNESSFIHTVVEATKQSFVNVRDQYITDPKYMKVDPQQLLSDDEITNLSNNIHLNNASQLRIGNGPGDTVWFGVMDSKGFSVSCTQSIFNIYGSRVVLPKTGILWHNRGASFSLMKDHLLSLEPGKKPRHTLNPVAARLRDGRVIVYGSAGGDGQPQTQAAVFHRYVVQDMPLQKSVSAPRWLYGTLSGDLDDKINIEDRFDEKTINSLKKMGHQIKMIAPFDSLVGNAGALVRYSNGMLEGAFDPRGIGSAVGF